MSELDKHKALNKYYTKKDVACQCISEMLKVVPADATFIEPSAGCGSFIFDNTAYAYDISPDAEGIIEANFLTVDIDTIDVCVYGNPPYGERNKLTKQFIKHAISFGGVRWVAFVLPSVFQKHTLQKVFPANWCLVSNTILPENSFTIHGNPYKIPCVFQVWEKDSKLTNLRAKERKQFSNKHFEIVVKDGDYFVMGASPTTLKKPNEVTPSNRGYWLKTPLPFDVLQSNLKEVPWNGKSCANGGVSWLTKTEFINQYEDHFKIGE